ncbi:MAG: hypothetical protein AAF432_06100 [Planctomycetota bacterium]
MRLSPFAAISGCIVAKYAPSAHVLGVDECGTSMPTTRGTIVYDDQCESTGAAR